MVTGNATLVRLLPMAPVRVLMTGNFDSGVNLTGRVSLYRFIDMSWYIFIKTSFCESSIFFIEFSLE